MEVFVAHSPVFHSVCFLLLPLIYHVANPHHKIESSKMENPLSVNKLFSLIPNTLFSSAAVLCPLFSLKDLPTHALGGTASQVFTPLMIFAVSSTLTFALS